MRKKIILALIIVVILLGGGFAYAYFGTDAFKSNKDIFFSYLTENKDKQSVEIADKLEKYLEKKENTGYTNKGKMSLNIKGADNESLDMLNNSKVTFEGKINSIQDSREQEITFDFSQGYNIPIVYKQDGDKYGIKSELLGDKIVAIRNDGLKELAGRFNIDSTYIPDKICIEDYQFTEEEQRILKDRYFSYIEDSLTEDMFTKSKIGKQKVITAKVSEDTAAAILTEMSKEFRDDEIILSKMPEGFNKEEFQQKMDDFISGIGDSVKENNIMEFSVYIQDKKLSKFEIYYYNDEEVYGKLEAEIKDNVMETKIYGRKQKLIADITTKYEVTGNDVSIEIKVKAMNSDQELNFAITSEYKNLLTLDNVEEEMTAKIGVDDQEINLNYSNAVTFDPNVQIEEIDENKTIIVNDSTDEELQELVLNVYKKLGLM